MLKILHRIWFILQDQFNENSSNVVFRIFRSLRLQSFYLLSTIFYDCHGRQGAYTTCTIYKYASTNIWFKNHDKSIIGVTVNMEKLVVASAAWVVMSSGGWYHFRYSLKILVRGRNEAISESSFSSVHL